MNLDKYFIEFVLEGQVNNIQAFVHTMALRRQGHKPLSELMMG